MPKEYSRIVENLHARRGKWAGIDIVNKQPVAIPRARTEIAAGGTKWYHCWHDDKKNLYEQEYSKYLYHDWYRHATPAMAAKTERADRYMVSSTAAVYVPVSSRCSLLTSSTGLNITQE